jgi:hypothetical protein
MSLAKCSLSYHGRAFVFILLRTQDIFAVHVAWYCHCHGRNPLRSMTVLFALVGRQPTTSCATTSATIPGPSKFVHAAH